MNVLKLKMTLLLLLLALFPKTTVWADQTICEGDIPEALSIVTAATNIQWQMSTTSCTEDFVNIDGATATTYTPPALNETTYYKALLSSTNADCCAYIANVDLTDGITIYPSGLYSNDLTEFYINGDLVPLNYPYGGFSSTEMDLMVADLAALGYTMTYEFITNAPIAFTTTLSMTLVDAEITNVVVLDGTNLVLQQDICCASESECITITTETCSTCPSITTILDTLSICSANITGTESISIETQNADGSEVVFAWFETAQTNPAAIYDYSNNGGIALDTITITGNVATAELLPILSVVPVLSNGGPQHTFYVYAILEGNDITCQSYAESVYIINPTPSLPPSGSVTVCVPSGEEFCYNAGESYTDANGIYYSHHATFEDAQTGANEVTEICATADFRVYHRCIVIETGCSVIGSTQVNLFANPTLTYTATCDANNTTYTIDFVSDGIVTSDVGTINDNQILNIPIDTDVVLTATSPNNCITSETIIDCDTTNAAIEDASCIPNSCLQIGAAKINE